MLRTAPHISGHDQRRASVRELQDPNDIRFGTSELCQTAPAIYGQSVQGGGRPAHLPLTRMFTGLWSVSPAVDSKSAVWVLRLPTDGTSHRSTTDWGYSPRRCRRLSELKRCPSCGIRRIALEIQGIGSAASTTSRRRSSSLDQARPLPTKTRLPGSQEPAPSNTLQSSQLLKLCVPNSSG